MLARTGITAKPASEEVDVKAVLSKVELGEADAGLVYATDAVAGGDKVKAVDIPTSNENLNTYPIAALDGRREADAGAGVRRPGRLRAGPAGARRRRASGSRERDADRAVGRAPARLLVPALVAVVFLALPMVALLVRTPWSDFVEPAHRARRSSTPSGCRW